MRLPNTFGKALPPLILATMVFFLLPVTGCKSKYSQYEPTYMANATPKKLLLFGVPNQPYYDATIPLVKYLNQRLDGVQVQTVGEFTYNDYLKKLDGQYYDFTILNGVKALECNKNGYTIEGKEADDRSYRGIILVHRDANINDVNDLKMRTVATVGGEALAGHMLPALFLQRNGINVTKELNFIYLGSFESAIMNVYLGNCAVAFCSYSAWKNFLQRRPEIASKVVLKWETLPSLNNALILKEGMDKAAASQLKKIFFSMHKDEEGRKALAEIGCTAFQPADSNTYRPLREFLKEYNAAFHQ